MAKLKAFEGENIIVKAIIFTIKDIPVKWDAMLDSDVSSKLGAAKKLFSDLTDLDSTFINILEKVGNINKCKVAYNSYVINFFEFEIKSKKRVEFQRDLDKKIKEKKEAEKSLKEILRNNWQSLLAENERLQKEKDENEEKYNIVNERLKELSAKLNTVNSLFDRLKSE